MKDTPKGKMIKGTLDNSLGCVINAELANKVEPAYETWFLFTVGEERGGYGAGLVLELFERNNISPSLCVAIDVTFPSKRKGEDTTLCYVEGFSNKRMKKIVEKFVKDNGLYPSVKCRDSMVFDESHVYGVLYPSFACGPVIYGSTHAESGNFDLVS